MVGQHEHRDVVGRLIAPPAFPAVVRPGPAHRPEHVAAQDPGTDVLEAAGGKDFVRTVRSLAFVADHALEAPGAAEPLVQSAGAFAHGILQALVRAGAVTVEGNGKAAYF
jgi:hypothetical protein